MTDEPYELNDLVTATFRPTVTNDLNGHGPRIGDTIFVEASWVYEDGPYAGQLAWTPYDNEDYYGYNIPTCDLADVMIVERGKDRYAIAGPSPTPEAAKRAADGLRAAYRHADQAGRDADLE